MMLTQWIRELTLRMWLIHGCVAAALGTIVTIIYFLAKLMTRVNAVNGKIDALSGVAADIVADTELIISMPPQPWKGITNGK